MATESNQQSNAIQHVNTAVEIIESQLVSYLDTVGLPSSQILAPISSRRPVINNMCSALESLTDSQKSNATYISKLVAACAVGLFDAALNYLWDETIRNLREKVARFDLEYFFDTVITDPNKRKDLKDADDLEKLADWELIRGCKESGIISDNGFRHLDYIRDMRNHASAAHPNQNDINGLEIISWLQRCIQEVLSREPSGPIVEIRRFLHNLRNEQLSAEDVPLISQGIQQLPQEQAGSLLRAVVGMYSDPTISTQVKDNIRLVAGSVWAAASEEKRYEAGLKQATLVANGDTSRATFTREFIEIVGGTEYLSDSIRSLELSTALENLMTAHDGWDNFHTEPGPAKLLAGIVPENGTVPIDVLHKYVKGITMCRMGNGYGVSWAARPYYEELFGRFSDDQIRVFVNLLHDSEVSSRLQSRNCAANFKGIAAKLNDRAVRPRVKAFLNFIQEYPQDSLKDITRDPKYLPMRQSLQV